MEDRLEFGSDGSTTPTHWYNIVADLPERPPPARDPRTHQEASPGNAASVMAEALLAQDAATDRWIEIPDDVRRVYQHWRPSPLYRARRLERELGTPARIYYKYEGYNPTGSHKTNTAVPQAYYSAQEGTRRLVTDTGAGQWGAALAFACAQYDVACEVFWTGSSYDQKPYRRVLMEAFGARVHRSPSDATESGRKATANGDSQGSIGLAVSEAIEVAATNADTCYALGSGVGFVLLHQTVIGQEALAQFALAEDYPDVVISCVGGGSSLGGLGFPFLAQNIARGRETRVLAVEPTACPTLTRGRYAWDHVDQEGYTPLVKMYTLGHKFVPQPIHAGGLRYHGVSPLLSYVRHLGMVDAVARPQTECFAAGLRFARTEGILSAPESAHAIAAAIDEAERCTQTGAEKAILMLVTGHGQLDLAAYDSYLAGNLVDAELTDEQLASFLARLPAVRD